MLSFLILLPPEQSVWVTFLMRQYGCQLDCRAAETSGHFPIRGKRELMRSLPSGARHTFAIDAEGNQSCPGDVLPFEEARASMIFVQA